MGRERDGEGRERDGDGRGGEGREREGRDMRSWPIQQQPQMNSEGSAI